MGLAPLNTPAQHQQKGGRRSINNQSNLCTSVPQSPTRIAPLRGVVSQPGTPVEESSQSPRRRSNLFTWNGTDLSNTFVEEVAPVGAPGGAPGGAQEATNPPTPALYCHDVLVSQPGLVGADMLSLGLALQQQGCTLPNQGSETNKEAENGVKVARESTGKGFRFWNGRIILGLGSLLVAGGMSLLSHSNKHRMGAMEKHC